MSSRPEVSVVVPLYNKSRTIGRTIDSVLAQTHGGFELIIVDDGSTDDGPEIVEAKYDDPRVRLVRQTNAGPAVARNNGAAIARGELITFLDADDAWRPELLERAVKHLGAHPECAAFTSAFYLEPAGVNRWAPLVADFGFSEGPWRLTPATPRPYLTHCLDAFHPSTSVYRRDVVLRYGGFFSEERCTFGEDVYLWIQIMLNHPIYRHMTPLAHYHMEDSELGIGARSGTVPYEPVITHPEPIRAACPAPLRMTLELWLAKHAARNAFLQLDRGDRNRAVWIMRRFPLIRAWRRDYAKLLIRTSVPTLWSVARRVVRGRDAVHPAIS